MTDIRFYHLMKRGVFDAIPVLLTKALSAGKRCVIRVPEGFDIKSLSNHLWSWNEDSFLAHGYTSDAQRQTIWIEEKSDNPSNADTLFLLPHACADNIYDYSLVCRIFPNDDDDALNEARAAWKSLKDKNTNLTYWQETEQGGWEKKS